MLEVEEYKVLLVLVWDMASIHCYEKSFQIHG